MDAESNLAPVLVIDDDPGVLFFLRLCLSRRGYRVDTAKNGEEGIQKIKANGYRAIITDIKMGPVSGNQVLSYVRGVPGKALPVIGMSGTPWFLDPEKFDAVLYKPCSVKDLLSVLHRVIEDSCLEGKKNRYGV
jgi:DNA-binding NtrC family response regulator